MLTKIKSFLSAVPDSIKGQINRKELIRVTLTAITVFIGASGVGGIGATLDYVQGNLNSIFPAMVEVGWLSGMVAFCFDFVRRKFVHGDVALPQIKDLKTTKVDYPRMQNPANIDAVIIEPTKNSEGIKLKLLELDSGEPGQ